MHRFLQQHGVILTELSAAAGFSGVSNGNISYCLGLRFLLGCCWVQHLVLAAAVHYSQNHRPCGFTPASTALWPQRELWAAMLTAGTCSLLKGSGLEFSSIGPGDAAGSSSRKVWFGGLRFDQEFSLLLSLEGAAAPGQQLGMAVWAWRLSKQSHSQGGVTGGGSWTGDLSVSFPPPHLLLDFNLQRRLGWLAFCRTFPCCWIQDSEAIPVTPAPAQT